MDEVIISEQFKKRPRKTIGEEGPKKQTLIIFVITIILGLIFYLPTELKGVRIGLTNLFNQEDKVIRIERPIGKMKDLTTVVGFKVEIKKKEDGQLAIERLIADQTGKFGIYVENLTNGENFGINQDTVLTAASVIKLPILTVYYQAVDKGKIDPETVYIIKNKDRLVYGTGSMQGQPAGTEYSYQEIAELVGKESDNMGAQLLINFLGGEVSVQKILKSWGLNLTSVIDNETTAKEMGILWKKIYEEKLLKPESKNKILESLTDTLVETRIPAGVPDRIRIRHKYGSEIGVVNDCGVVEARKPYVVCILSNEINDGQVEELLPKISRVVWEWLGN